MYYQQAVGNLKYCDKNTNCKCFKPKCKDTSPCKKAKGRCFTNKIVPNGWSLIKKSGKAITCNKALKCYCYKNTKSLRDLDNFEHENYSEKITHC